LRLLLRSEIPGIRGEAQGLAHQPSVEEAHRQVRAFDAGHALTKRSQQHIRLTKDNA
jgi:hypothetical protein